MRSQCTRLAFGLALALALLGAAPPLPAQEAPKAAECKVPEEAAKKENPSKADAGSISEGRRLFESQCAMCHGKSGDGKGELAATMNLSLKDYSKPAALKDVSDGAMFYVMQKGCGQMLGEEGRLKSDQMWNLVNFIRSLGKKHEVAEKKEPPPQS